MLANFIKQNHRKERRKKKTLLTVTLSKSPGNQFN